VSGECGGGVALPAGGVCVRGGRSGIAAYRADFGEESAVIEIKDRWAGEVIYTSECGSVSAAVVEAITKRKPLSRADLSRADLSGADLSGANLSRADLSGADLSRADLSRADLSRADLSGADLSRADLSGADLSRANLSRADLSGAKNYNRFRTTPLLMLLDQPGAIRAYKLVTAEGDGPFNGGITYEVGRSYEVLDANTSETEACAAGLHVATLDWCMREWREGYRIIVVEFEAKDIAAIPVATDGKFRLFRLRVVGEKDLSEIGLIDKPSDAKEPEAVA